MCKRLHSAYFRAFCLPKFASPNSALLPKTEYCTAITVNELLVLYLNFAERYYSKDGEPTKEFICMKEAAKPLKSLYGTSLTSEFGPCKLKAIQQHLVSKDLSRTYINNIINRIKRIFKWALSEELLPVSVYERIRTVGGLRYGRTEAREIKTVSASRRPMG